MMDEGDMFVGQRGDGPVFAKEVEGAIGVLATLKIPGQVQAKQRDHRHRAVVVALFFESEFSGRVVRQASGATDVLRVVPGDLGAERGVGGQVVGDFLVGQEGDQAVLQRAEAAFDFALA
ncbi:MAG: hypothetical protein KIS67_06550 [Verrucomicrobiae bacterium]|nr:hypothetical protein [Verrucomicrobiae bacterium]